MYKFDDIEKIKNLTQQSAEQFASSEKYRIGRTQQQIEQTNKRTNEFMNEPG